MEIDIRRAELADLNELIELYKTVGEAVSGTDNDPMWEVGVYPTIDSLSESLKNGEFYIAVKDGRIAGAMAVNRNIGDGYEKVDWKSDLPLEDSVIIHLFGMHPDFKGHGIGRTLMAAVEDDLRDRGEKIMRLDVMAQNAVAQKIYERLGFTYCGMEWLVYDDLEGNFAFFEKEL